MDVWGGLVKSCSTYLEIRNECFLLVRPTYGQHRGTIQHQLGPI